MTRKDYQTIADALRRADEDSASQWNCAFDDVRISVMDNVIHQLSDALQRDNPQFDAQRFRDVCGI